MHEIIKSVCWGLLARKILKYITSWAPVIHEHKLPKDLLLVINTHEMGNEWRRCGDGIRNGCNCIMDLGVRWIKFNFWCKIHGGNGCDMW